MRFETIKYVEWIRTRQGVKIDLCRSGTESFSLKDLNINWEGLEISGENAYGYHPLLEAIASRYKVREENVVTTIGASHALFLACAALLARGDEVLVEKPAYEPLLAVPAAMEAKILRFERRFEEGFQVDVKEFESLLSSKTKLVILSNLHNPSGTLLSRSLLNNLAGIAQKKGVRILVDEIYLEFLEGPEKESSYSLADNIIVISSLTKAYGLGGLRCGWILAPAELAKRIRAVIDYTNIDGVFIGEQISARIFSQLDSIHEKNKGLVGQNREMIRDFIQEEERLKWVEPAGGVACFPKVEAGLSGDSLAALLQEKYRTSVVPGSFFEEPQHFRLGFGVAPSILASALKYIKKALEQF